MNLTKTQILNGNYEYPEDFVHLQFTKHFISRLEERGLGLECIPTMVRVTRNNIHSGKTRDKRRLHSVVIRIDYSGSRWLFLAFNPYDGAAKSLWFKEKTRKVLNKIL